MATGFKKATVNASDIPATQTNFPAYVDLSRVGITTLAEAQSVRVYADSSKTTEWAREIVSVTEMHVKIPSLTSTTDIYVSWDGSSADYAVTDTYGRNAVWSDYVMVSHMYDLTTSTVQDATGNNTLSKSSAGNPNEVSSVFGKGQSYQNNSDAVTPDNYFNYGTVTYSAWAKNDSFNSYGFSYYLDKRNGPSNGAVELIADTAAGHQFVLRSGSGWRTATGPNSSVSSGVAHHVVGTYDGSNLICYEDGVAGTPLSYSGSIENLNIYNRIGGSAGYSQYYFVGEIAESRVRSGALSANWITSEYNNQSDETGFWGTWSTVSSGTTNSNFFMFM